MNFCSPQLDAETGIFFQLKTKTTPGVSLYIIFRVFHRAGENFPRFFSFLASCTRGERVNFRIFTSLDDFLDGCAKTNCCNCLFPGAGFGKVLQIFPGRVLVCVTRRRQKVQHPRRSHWRMLLLLFSYNLGSHSWFLLLFFFFFTEFMFC